MGTDKALLAWPPVSAGQADTRSTFLSAAIERLSPYVDMVIVVAGDNTANLAPVVYATGGVLITNPDPARGQFSSLQCGLREVLNRGRDAAMVTLVNRPPVEAATVEQLRTAFEEAVEHRQWAVAPEYQGQHGHPILAARELIEAFLRAPDSTTTREIMDAHPDKIEYVAVDDPFVTENVDTPEQYSALSWKKPQSN
jgi:molybdenum cofactor cytidylyltransferase